MEEDSTRSIARLDRLEALRFTGLSKPFPCHFHETYVIGLLERGERRLSCKDGTRELRAGHLVFFAPGERHGCVPTGDSFMDYRSLSLPSDLFLQIVEGEKSSSPLAFTKSAIADDRLASEFYAVCDMVLSGQGGPSLSHRLTSFLSLVTERYGLVSCAAPACDETARLCVFLREHLGEPISLELLCRRFGLSKSTLLRTFSAATGVTPYRYLESLRIEAAKRLLSSGATPAEVALKTGFSDQSHLTNVFKRHIGLTPGAYHNRSTPKEGVR